MSSTKIVRLTSRTLTDEDNPPHVDITNTHTHERTSHTPTYTSNF